MKLWTLALTAVASAALLSCAPRTGSAVGSSNGSSAGVPTGTAPVLAAPVGVPATAPAVAAPAPATAVPVTSVPVTSSAGLSPAPGPVATPVAAPGCTLNPEQDQANAQDAARRYAQGAFASQGGALNLFYRDVQSSISVGAAQISGTSATVVGTVNLRGVNRLSGQAASGSYPGRVSLVRQGCGWQATGYARG